MGSNTIAACFTLALVLGVPAVLRGQSRADGRLDLAVTYTAERSLNANTAEHFFTQGGSIELGANAYRGLGIALNVSGTHAASVGSSNIPLSLVTVTCGPRYRFHAKGKLSVYGEALAGEANAFHTIVPAIGRAQDSANGLALQFGGGIDYAPGRRYALRLIDAAYVRTQLPNSTNNVQNNLQLGAGFVLRFR